MKKRMVSLLVSALFLLGTGAWGADSSGSVKAVVESNNFNPKGYPIVKNKITLNVMLGIRDTDTVMGNPEDLAEVKALEELTNIHINWTVVKGADWNTKINIMFASGEYPDVIMNMQGPVDVEEYGVSQKILLPLDELINKYMPTYRDRAKAEPADPLIPLRASNGRMYQVGFLVAQNINTNSHYFINKKWLDALKLKTPTTLDQLTDVLRAFKTKDPNGNGKADEVPYQIMLNDGMYSVRMALPFFGIPLSGSGRYVYLDDNKKATFAPTQKGFRDAMQWLHTLYAEKLLDVEVVSQALSVVESKLADGNMGFFTGWRLVNMGWDKVIGDFSLFDPVPSKGYKVAMERTMEFAKNGSYITVANKNVAETLRWFDAQLVTDNMFSLANGAKGTGWKVNDKGMIETYSKPKDVILGVNAMFFAPGKYYFGIAQMPPSRLQKMEFCKLYTEKGFMQKNSNSLLTFAKRTADEVAECTTIETDVSKTVNEYMAQFVQGGVTDAKWNEFVGIFKKMNIDKYVGIYENALKRSGYK